MYGNILFGFGWSFRNNRKMKDKIRALLLKHLGVDNYELEKELAKLICSKRCWKCKVEAEDELCEECKKKLVCMFRGSREGDD